MLSRVWAFLEALFWIAKLDRRAERTNHRLFRYLRWCARGALVFYLVSIPVLLVSNLAAGKLSELALLPINIVLFPFLFRLVILMNVAINGQTMKEANQ